MESVNRKNSECIGRIYRIGKKDKKKTKIRVFGRSHTTGRKIRESC